MKCQNTLKLVHAFEPNPIIYKDIEKNLKKIIKNINFYNFASIR